MARLLLAEDDELLRDGLCVLLTQAGHDVDTAPDGQQALQMLQKGAFEGVVLDLGLPLLDGMQVLAELRQAQPVLPVLILTARDALEDRIDGLQAGADDYLTKPFSPDELLVRVQSMLRRASLPAFAPQGSTSQGIHLDPASHRIWFDGQPVELTSREWALLELLVRNIGQVVSREAVLEAWQAQPQDGGPPALASNALEVYVHRLRRKLADSAYVIRNIRGLGYLLEQNHP